MLTGLILLFATAAVHAGPELRRFDSDSYQAIVEAHRGEPFLLVFWSLECPPCYKELQMLGEAGAGEAFAAVFVSTDGPAEEARITETMQRFGLERAESWVFDGNPPQLRFSIDRTWYGELPKSYLFDASHQRKAITGLLERAAIDPLLEHGAPSE